MSLISRNIYIEIRRGMWEGWTCKKYATYQRYKPITYFTLRSSSGFGLGDNAGEENYGERYRDREREGEGEREREREREREGERGRGRGRCDFLVLLHDKNRTDQVEA
jgi:hypothetical protein